MSELSDLSDPSHPSDPSELDPLELRGKKLCNSNLYFDTIYATSNFYIYSLCHDAELNNCTDILAKVYVLKLKSW